MPATYTVILNAASGAKDKEQVRDSLLRTFAESGFRATVELASGGEIENAARRALDGGAATVVAGGGDGTISTVAGILAGTPVALGVLPLGTLNHFAKDLKIPLDLESAVRNVCGGRTVQVDVGEVNGRVFVNNSSLGIYPHMVQEREQRQRRFGNPKWVAMARASLTVLRRWPLLNVRLQAEGQSVALKTPFVFVGNNRYEMENRALGTRTALDRGELSLVIARRTGRMDIVLAAANALLGGLRGSDDLATFAATELVVETRRKELRVAADGEVSVRRSPLHYRIRPGALRVIVPAQAEGSAVNG
jgi:diacylglycerol kinase family enzyme